MSGYVYILKSLKNGQYYIGSTNDLERRLIEHNSGKGCLTTKRLLPFELVFQEEFEYELCRKIEYKLKSLKSRKIIEETIDNGKIDLIRLKI